MRRSWLFQAQVQTVPKKEMNLQSGGAGRGKSRYDLNAEETDDDAIFLEKAIRLEKNEEMKMALQDLV